MFEIKHAVVVVVFIFLKHDGLCVGDRRLEDSNYFYTGINTGHEFSCTRNVVCVQVTCTVVTVHSICEDLKFLHGYLKPRINNKLPKKADRRNILILCMNYGYHLT